MGYPRHQRARDFKLNRLSTGDFTVTATSFTDLSTAIDITLVAQVGDVLETSVSACAFHSNGLSLICLDAQTRVSGAGVNYISGGLVDGVTGWRQQPANAANIVPVTGYFLYAVVTGDVSGGTVTLRLRSRTNTGTITWSADGASSVLQWSVKNLGPADPN